jgi:membrane AbrB-like protein
LRADLRRLALALAIGAVGSVAFWWLKLPLAFLLGALAATGIAAVCGLDIAVPNGLRGAMVALLGATIGASFTPEVLANAGKWLGSLAVVTVSVAIMSCLAYVCFRRIGEFDRVTAFFGAAPGGLGVMTVAGESMGGDPRTIALVHTARVVVVVFAVPIHIKLVEHIDLPSTVALAGGDWGLHPLGLAEVTGAAIAGHLIALLLRLPAASIIGPMVVSAVAHLTGLFEAAPPSWLIAVTQWVMGAAIGARFAGFSLRAMGGAMAQGGMVSVATMAVAIGISTVVAAPFGLSPVALMLALAPGGLAEMCLVAVALNIDPAFVATMHVVRLVLVVMLAPLIYQALAKRHRSQ